MKKCSKKIMNNTSEFKLQCSCNSEMLHITRFDEWEEWDICIWYRGFNPMSLWDKIKYCLRVLYKGEIYSDQLIFKRNQILLLRNFLNRELIKTRKYNNEK